MCRTGGFPHRLTEADRRFVPEAAHFAHRDERRAIFRRRLAELTQAEAPARLEGQDLSAPVRDRAKPSRTPTYAINEMVTEVPHPTLGRFRTLGLPAKLSCLRGWLRPPASTPGEHTNGVRREETRVRAGGVA